MSGRDGSRGTRANWFTAFKRHLPPLLAPIGDILHLVFWETVILFLVSFTRVVPSTRCPHSTHDVPEKGGKTELRGQ